MKKRQRHKKVHTNNRWTLPWTAYRSSKCNECTHKSAKHYLYANLSVYTLYLHICAGHSFFCTRNLRCSLAISVMYLIWNALVAKQMCLGCCRVFFFSPFVCASSTLEWTIVVVGINVTTITGYGAAFEEWRSVDNGTQWRARTHTQAHPNTHTHFGNEQ